MSDHEHVTLDQAVFDAYVDVAIEAEAVVTGRFESIDLGRLRYFLERLEQRVRESHAGQRVRS